MTDPAEVAPEVYVEPAEATPEAVAVFGQERIDEAVAELTDLVTAEAFPEALLDPADVDVSRDELAGEVFLDRLTPEAADSWLALVDAALDGDQDDKDAVRTIRYFGIEQPWTVPENEQVVQGQEITDVQVEVETPDPAGADLLVVTFDHDATLAYLQDGELVELLVEKEMTYELTPVATEAVAEAGASWLIANFRGEFEVTTSS